jgi:hypothetical protein
MSEREGNTNAARVEEREVRSARTSGFAPLEEDRGVQAGLALCSAGWPPWVPDSS